MMGEMQSRLETDHDLAGEYHAAHDDYMAARAALGIDRVKCLHSLIAHSLAAGPGVNPLGDEALAALADWWKTSPCE